MQGEIRQGFKQTEVGVIPEDWDCVAVADVASRKPNAIVGGPFGSDLVSTDYVPFGVPVIRGQNMSGVSVNGEFAFVSLEKAKALKANTAAPGDLVFTQRGTLGQVCRVPPKPFCSYLVSQSQMKLSPNNERFDTDFLLQYFHSEPGQKKILDSSIQTGVPHTNLGILRSYKLPEPPLHEQRAIAAALSDADALIAALEVMIAKKRDLKQAAMQHLLTGKTRLPGFSGEWDVKRIGEVSSIQRGASPRPIDSPIWFDELSRIGWVRISDVSKSDMFLSSATQRLSPLGVARSRQVEVGSLIMSIAATVGRPAITQIECCIHDGFVVFSNLKVEKTFLYFVLRDIEPKWSKQGQTGSQMNLNTAMIGGTEIMVPPTLAEQIAIAEVLSDMDSDLAALEVQAAKARAIKQGMMQELLTGRVRLV
jgi:type I restriction enzyme S subunit